MSKSIFIFGSTGYLGGEFSRYFEENGYKVFSERVNIENFREVKEVLEKYKPDIVFHAAGKTGRPNVDWCETHVAETLLVNVNGSVNIASACNMLGIYCVYLSSGCVYAGNNNGKGFSEEDTPNFYGSMYSRSKAYTENILKEFENILQLRVRMPISEKPNFRNMIDKLKKYEKIISVENSFTVIEDLLPASLELIEKEETGIFNMTNKNSTNHEYIMNKYKEIVDPSFHFEVMSLDELKKYAVAERSNAVLNTSKSEKFGVAMPEIERRLESLMQEYKIHLEK